MGSPYFCILLAANTDECHPFIRGEIKKKATQSEISHLLRI